MALASAGFMASLPRLGVVRRRNQTVLMKNAICAWCCPRDTKFEASRKAEVSPCWCPQVQQTRFNKRIGSIVLRGRTIDDSTKTAISAVRCRGGCAFLLRVGHLLLTCCTDQIFVEIPHGKTMTDNYKAFKSFEANGFSDRTIKTLLANGVDGPQQLLVMDPRAIRCIPGVGNFCMKEIERYRARFLDDAAVPGAGHVA